MTAGAATRWSARALAASSVLLIAAMGLVGGGLLAGYRPVVLQTGSMGATAPPGSLVVAGPRGAEAVAVGDIVVMRRPGATPVTHRVMEIESHDGARFAVTKGDANEALDAAPYPLDGEQLVARWIVPRVGFWMQRALQPTTVLVLMALAVAAVVVQGLRRIWRPRTASDAGVVAGVAAIEPTAHADHRSGPEPGAAAADETDAVDAAGHRRTVMEPTDAGPEPAGPDGNGPRPAGLDGATVGRPGPVRRARRRPGIAEARPATGGVGRSAGASWPPPELASTPAHYLRTEPIDPPRTAPTPSSVSTPTPTPTPTPPGTTSPRPPTPTPTPTPPGTTPPGTPMSTPTAPDGREPAAEDRWRARLPDRSRARRLVAALTVLPAVGLVSGGVAWAMLTSTTPLTANQFDTLDCFDPQLTTVQRGETAHAISGTVSAPLANPVDPSQAFVLSTVRSSGNRPPDANVRVDLSADGSAVELHRLTTSSPPPTVTVAWSVVHYGCGLSVQRGVASGTGAAWIDVPIGSVDTGASFALMTTSPGAGDSTFGSDDVLVAELTSSTNLRIRAAAALSGSRSVSWQVITFDDPGDVAVQTGSTSLGPSDTVATVALAQPADPETTFLLVGITSSGTGSDIGARMVRARQLDANTVEVTRARSGVAVDVSVQVVTLRDGSTVRRGTVDLGPGLSSASATFAPVDLDRSTALATVTVPGNQAGGSTDHSSDDVPGEGMGVVALTDGRTVTVTRDATASSASLGWQVIEWGGPRWWDDDYVFRQRITVEAGTADAPTDYSAAVVVDHAALVDLGLSRADGDDVRIVRWDGTTWTELDRILGDGESWNTTSTALWFRTTEAVAAGAVDSYWLYVGHGGATAAPADPDRVWLLTEDFESGDLGVFVDRTASGGWYTADPWTGRLTVTVPAGRVGADLADFPLLVSVVDSDLGVRAQTDGSDIRFTAGDGSPLAHEIERWDPGTGALEAWVRVPTLAAGSATTVQLYYGAADAPDQSDTRGTWADEVAAVWHLAADPAGSAPQLDDSSPGAHDGLADGSMTNADLVSGRAGLGLDLDGSDDVLRSGPLDLVGVDALTLSGWVRLDAHSPSATVVSKTDGAGSPIAQVAIGSGGEVIVRLGLDGSTTTLTSTAGAVPTGAWHHVAASWDGATVRAVVDGTEVASSAAAGALDGDAATGMTIGDEAAGGAALDGLVDEVRVETVARSDDWLAALVANHGDPSTFLSVGSAQTGTWLGQGTWAARKPVTIAPGLVDTDLTDLVVLVQATAPDVAARARADGADLVFTSGDGTTRLDHQLEAWDATGGALAAWVRIPSVTTSGGAELYLYYGNPTAADQQDPAAVHGDQADLVVVGP